MSPGDRLARSYTVRVDDNLISGTQIVNDDYRASWYELELGAILSNTGPAITTTVHEVGLIDSFKVVADVSSTGSEYNPDLYCSPRQFRSRFSFRRVRI